MSRNMKKEQAAFDAALKYFDNDMNRFVYAINTRLLKNKHDMVSTQAVAYWRKDGIPSNRAKIIEEATNKVISREQLRPDLFL